MKALILAAGRGSRLGAMTDQRPKCLVELDRRPGPVQRDGGAVVHISHGRSRSRDGFINHGCFARWVAFARG